MRADAIASAAFALFGAIYEHFGHGVYSYFMLYAFLIPLLFGALPLMYIRKKLPERALVLYHCALGTLTVGSIFQGVLEIYGTTNRMIWVYPVAAGLLLIAAVISGIVHRNDVYEANDVVTL